MKFPPYTQYRPSGVEWLGDVPKHWEVKRLKTSALYRVSSVNKVPADDEIPVRLCNYTDVYYNEHITPEMDLMEATATSEEIEKYRLEVNDVVITKDSEEWSDIAVPALVTKSADDLVCGYHLAIVRPKKDSLLGSYLLRLFQASAVNRQFQLASTGVTRYGLPKSAIGEAWIPLPPLDEQTAIAEHLAGELGRVEALIAKKHELIRKLREKRSALISHTVTRGLPSEIARAAGIDPTPKLKSSGVDWLGDIPQQWSLTPLRYLVRFKGGATPDKGNPEYWNGEIPWVSPKDMKTANVLDAEDHITMDAVHGSRISMVPVRSVLIVVRGMILAHSFPVAITGTEVTINQDMKALLCGSQIIPEFLFWALSGLGKVFVSLADESAHGTKKLETDTIARTMVPIPPRQEQLVLVKYLEQQTTKIDSLVEKAQSAIRRLIEYRVAVTTAAVTGRIDVRTEAA